MYTYQVCLANSRFLYEPTLKSEPVDSVYSRGSSRQSEIFLCMRQDLRLIQLFVYILTMST